MTDVPCQPPKYEPDGAPDVTLPTPPVGQVLMRKCYYRFRLKESWKCTGLAKSMSRWIIATARVSDAQPAPEQVAATSEKAENTDARAAQNPNRRWQ